MSSVLTFAEGFGFLLKSLCVGVGDFCFGKSARNLEKLERISKARGQPVYFVALGNNGKRYVAYNDLHSSHYHIMRIGPLQQR